MRWPTLMLSESQVVTEEWVPHFRIAVGGPARMVKKNTEAETVSDVGDKSLP
jgi:acetyltransferase-like isoleucine patch superfamily enzyme